MTYAELLTVREACNDRANRQPPDWDMVAALLDHIDAIGRQRDIVEESREVVDRYRNGGRVPDSWTASELLGVSMLLDELLPLMVDTGGRR